MEAKSIFSKDLMSLMIIGFCFSSSYLLTFISVSSYTSYQFGLDASAGGLAACIFVAGSLISRLTLARKIKTVGKTLLLYMTLLSLGVSMLYLILPGYVSLIFVRFLHGFFFGLSMLIINSMVIEIVPATRRSEGLGYFMLSYTLSSAISPFIAITLSHGQNYSMIFIVNILILLISLFAYFMLGKGVLKPITKESKKTLHVSDFIEKSALKMSVVVMFFYLAYCSFLTFVSQYGDLLDLGWAASVTFIAYAISSLVARLFFGRIADIRGENCILIPCLILFVFGFVILAFADTSWMILVPGLLFGFSVPMMNSVGQSMAVRNSSPDRFPISLSTFQIFMDSANGIGPFILGSVVVAVGYADMYIFASGLALISLLAYLGFNVGKRNAA